MVLSAIQLRKNDVQALARVRASSQYFPVWDCVSYSCARKRSWLPLWLGLQSAFSCFGLYIVQYARRMSWLSVWFGLSVSIFSLVLSTKKLRKNDVLALARVRASSQYCGDMTFTSVIVARWHHCICM